ncbi:MAG: hypothetical protein SF051_12195 [Elusimicrobiota bacterium]|nr:hypothetical protein [Elusimicrobiota bacterium]
MTIWALALLATCARAATVAPARSAAPSAGGVRAVPAVVVPSLGGGLGGVGTTLGSVDLRGSLSLPTPAPGLLPTASFVPPGALQFKRVDAQAASAPSPIAADAAAPASRADASARRATAGLVPEDPTGAVAVPAIPAPRRDSASSPSPRLAPAALGTAMTPGPAEREPGVEASVDAGRVLFDNGVARGAVDAGGAFAPAPPAASPRAGLLPGRGATGETLAAPASGAPRSGVPGPAIEAPVDADASPDAGLVAARLPLPGAAGEDLTLRDAVASPRPAGLDAVAAGLRGGHAPLFARPDRLTLSGEGLVVSVVRAPGADGLLRGRAAWTAPPAAQVPSPARRLVSTDHIERGALLEAASASDAAVGRGLLALGDHDIPGALAGSLRAAADGPAPARPRAPASRRAGSATVLALSFLPLAAFLALRRFL